MICLKALWHGGQEPSKIRPLPPKAIDIVLKEWAIAQWMRRHNLLVLKFIVQRTNIKFHC
jgi:hypothetical protein